MTTNENPRLLMEWDRDIEAWDLVTEAPEFKTEADARFWLDAQEPCQCAIRYALVDAFDYDLADLVAPFNRLHDSRIVILGWW